MMEASESNVNSTSEEKRSARVKKWALAHKESRKLYRQEWYTKNKNKVTAAHEAWRKENMGRHNQTNKKWVEENPGKTADAVRTCRARKYGVTIEPFSALEIYERDNWECQICHKKVNRKLKWPHPLSATLDHIIALKNGGAHSRQNTQLAHLVCNMKAFTGGVKQTRLM